MKFKGTYV